MEGACGKILSTDDPRVVLKKIHRRNRPQQRASSLRAEQQAQIQEKARALCCEMGCKILYVPRAWGAEAHSYKMERIDVETPLLLSDIKHHPVFAELKAFYTKAKEAGIFPADYELYVQADGRVAMVDFDKFGAWLHDGTMQFPWGLLLLPEQIQDLLNSIL